MSTCSKPHRHAACLKNLPEFQGTPGRHKCAGCAYEAGFIDGFNNTEYNFDNIIDMLPDSQAGSGRHRDPEVAYREGYAKGQELYHG